jgi:hypothetical protein
VEENDVVIAAIMPEADRRKLLRGTFAMYDERKSRLADMIVKAAQSVN